MNLHFDINDASNQSWPSINVWPCQLGQVGRIIIMLAKKYGFAPPRIVTVDQSHYAESNILGSMALFLLDRWTFSISVETEWVRDRLLEDLQNPPIDFVEKASAA